MHAGYTSAGLGNPPEWERRAVAEGARSRTKPGPRAVPDLGQLADEQLFARVAEGLSLLHDHVVELERCVQADARPRAVRVLIPLLEEEAAKYLILLDAVRCPRAGLRDQLRKFADHVARATYADACDWHAATFGDLRGYIERDLEKFYLDGPNDVDWIFPNRLKADREQALYVDYLRQDDGGHRWHSPMTFDEDMAGMLRHPRWVVGLVKSLHAVGLGSAGALAQVAALWRGFTPADDTHVEDVRGLNRRTLEVLNAAGLLAACAEGTYGAVAHDWIFPLHSLPLTLKTIDLDELRQQQDAWDPDW
jgi:hypothetical protein